MFGVNKSKVLAHSAITVVIDEKKQHVPTILQTPEAVIKNVLFPDMDEKALAAFSQTSFYANTLTKPVLTKQKLLNHVICGEEAEAKKMLETNPRLLLRGLARGRACVGPIL